VSISSRRRESFDAAADLYSLARPPYPESLVDDLFELTGMSPGDRVLEIGPGTGQLSISLAGRGVSLVAVELGSRLATILQEALAPFPRATVIRADFDDWKMPAEPFKVIVAATSFHWLDPATRVERCVSALEPGGTLAIVETHWGAGAPDDAFTKASQKCYARWYAKRGSHYAPRTPASPPQHKGELEASGLLTSILHRTYLAEREHTANTYCDLVSTFSEFRALPPSDRQGFLSCIAALINERFAGRLVRRDVHDLMLGRRAPIA
jgi:trans-aconitate methyltransferase